jgi:F-type H+-transporting ATPase subunit delta
MSSLVAKKYVKAILDLDGIPLSEVVETLNSLGEVIESDERVKELLNSPLVSSSQKLSFLIEPLRDRLDKRVVNLLSLMAEKKRLNLIPEVAKLLRQEVQFNSNSFKGLVESNERVDASLIKKLEDKLSKYSGADISLEFKESNLDGVKVEVEDLGLELSFSKEAVRKALFEHIKKAL